MVRPAPAPSRSSVARTAVQPSSGPMLTARSMPTPATAEPSASTTETGITRVSRLLTGAAMMTVASLTAPIAPAQAAVVADQDAATFISSLGTEAFAVLKTGNKGFVRAKFRELLSRHFAIDAIGDRLILDQAQPRHESARLMVGGRGCLVLG